MFSGGRSACSLGTQKKFRLFLIFQSNGSPQKTVWLVSYGMAWAVPEGFEALPGTSPASSGARCRRGGLVPGWAAVSPRAASCLGASGEGTVPASCLQCSASCWARLRSSQFWSRVTGSSALSGPCSAACWGHALLHWQHGVSNLPAMLRG